MSLTDQARHAYDNYVTDPNNPFDGMERLSQHLADNFAATKREADVAVLQAHTERQHEKIANLRSNAAAARDILESLDNTNSTIHTMINSASFSGDNNMARTLTLIHKVQSDLHKQIRTVLS